MPNPLERAHEIAKADHARMTALIRRIGTREYRRGRIMRAYSVANRAMRGLLRTDEGISAARDARPIMSELRTSVMATLDEVIDMAERYGQTSAVGQLRAYGITPVILPAASQIKVQAATAIASNVDQISTVAQALIATKAEKDLIVGGAHRVGLLSPGSTAKALSYWALTAMWDIWGGTITAAVAPSALPFKKQVVATMDTRVTGCCLNAHGQIVDIDKPFYTPDPPAWSGFQDWVPFHDYCRSAVVLYLEEYDIGLTAAMLTTADRLRVTGEGRRPRTAIG